MQQSRTAGLWPALMRTVKTCCSQGHRCSRLQAGGPASAPAGKIPRLEARHDSIGDDDFGRSVGQRALQPVADFDAHLALEQRDQQQHAIAFGHLARLPRAEKLIGVRLYGIAFK